MSKTKDVIEGSKPKSAAKKVAKSTLTFPVKDTPIKESFKDVIADAVSLDLQKEPFVDVLPEEPISAKKDIEEVKPKSKTPNFSEEVRTVASAVKEVSLPVEEKQPVNGSASNSKPSYQNGDRKPFNKNSQTHPHKPFNKDLPPVTGQYPEHMVNIACIVKNNAEIRRFTALGILNYLLQKGEIKGNSKFVSFKWNKFTVKVDNLVKEYSYGEAFFLNCLVASFSSFSASAQRTINDFTIKELNKGLGEVADEKEVERIFDANEKK